MAMLEITTELISALEIIMDPLSDPIARRAAHESCENFKANSPLCVECGFLLADKANTPIVRHFGLQLIENGIKFRWNDLKIQQKVLMKNNIFEVMSSGTDHITRETAYVKEALAKLVVLMVCREWPQQWPSLLEELLSISIKGDTQTELVVFIFRRLAEDVVEYEKLPKSRKKDVYQALYANLPKIFDFFLKILDFHSTQYLQLVPLSHETNQQEVLVHCQLVETLIHTLAAFVDWAPWQQITADNNLILQMLCTFLNDTKLRFYAVDCLLGIVGRKGKVEERTPLLVLFSEDAMNIIFSAASSTSESILENQQYYDFLRKLGELLVKLGIQLAAMWGTVDNVKEPQMFETYLNSILSFTRHPSLILTDVTFELWACFFQHSIISKTEIIQSHIIPELVKILAQKLVKICYPCNSKSMVCKCAKLDFDSQVEVIAFQGRVRCNSLNILRLILKVNGQVVYGYAVNRLEQLLSSREQDFSHNSKEYALQMEALATYIGDLTTALNATNSLQYYPKCFELLQCALDFESDNPLHMSPLISCISALYVILTVDASLLPAVLEKLFKCAMFPLPQNENSTNFKMSKIVRKHAGGCIIKIAKEHPKLLFPVFDKMYCHIKNLAEREVGLSLVEQCTLSEALVIISNEFQNYNTQCHFLEELLGQVKTVFLTLISSLPTVDSFITFVGLKESGGCAETARNRLQLSHCINMFLGVGRRTKYPEDQNIAQNGGFVQGGSIKNPASVHILPMMESLFIFLKYLNALHNPVEKAKFSEQFSTVLDLTDAENTIPNTHETITDSNVMEEEDVPTTAVRVKNFINNLYEYCPQIFGHACLYYGQDFYSVPNIFNLVSDNMFYCIEYLPDFRLRSLLRFIIRPLFMSCPTSFYPSAAIVFEKMASFMYQKLSKRWEMFRQQYGSLDTSEEMTEAKEILADQLNRLLSREYIELLHAICRAKKISDSSMDSQDSANLNTNLYELSELALFLIRDTHTRASLVLILFDALHWLDTTACNKSGLISEAVFKQLASDRLIIKEDEAVFLLQSTLMGLAELGEHEQIKGVLMTLAFTVYETMKLVYPSISQKFLQMVRCDPKCLERLDSMILKGKAVSERKKKAIFRNLLSKVVGQNVGQRFKNDIEIRNLPAILKNPRNFGMEDSEEGYKTICALFSSDAKD